jgi:aminomethyltransferase
MELVHDYGDWPAEYRALRENAGVLDLGARSRLCVLGADRSRFLHGQVTNDVKKLQPGDGCYAAITTAKGKMEADMNIFCLAEELLLDLEPGLAEKITRRLEKFIVADDVQVVDAAAHYGLLSVQGPKAEIVVQALGLFGTLPAKQLASVTISNPEMGELYLARNSRLGGPGYDLFVPNQAIETLAGRLVAAAGRMGGRLCGSRAFETVRIESGIPRFGADMDENSIPLECGIEARAISYTKGCYIGQEVINRIHSVGHVNRKLRSLRIAGELPKLPRHGDKLFHAGKEAGFITSAANSPAMGNVALGFVRREAIQAGAELTLKTAQGEWAVKTGPLC